MKAPIGVLTPATITDSAVAIVIVLKLVESSFAPTPESYRVSPAGIGWAVHFGLVSNVVRP